MAKIKYKKSEMSGISTNVDILIVSKNTLSLLSISLIYNKLNNFFVKNTLYTTDS